jgi:hypothetical protein
MSLSGGSTTVLLRWYVEQCSCQGFSHGRLLFQYRLCFLVGLSSMRARQRIHKVQASVNTAQEALSVVVHCTH